MYKLILVAGARPNFMKIAPLMKAASGLDVITPILVHTGQHYDENMSRVFFDDLAIPRPGINLGVGSGSHAVQTARIMMGFEKVLLEEEPDLVVVVGDVNSTIACSLTAQKMGVRVAHVEAGLRSRNWAMPEEINRVLTDRLSDLLFTTSRDAGENLLREGIDPDRIHFVGNVMIDTLLGHVRQAARSDIHERLGIERGSYGVLTLHRPSNVDSPEQLGTILDIMDEVRSQIPVVYPVHARTRKMLHDFGLTGRITDRDGLIPVDPLGYLDFLSLMKHARLVMTDSGGIQEETTVLGVPCLTLREETERPVTVTQGTNEVVGIRRDEILGHVDTILRGHWKTGRIPELWDGKAAHRIIRIILEELGRD